VRAEPHTLRSLDSAWEVNSSQAFTATFHNYYFPGWAVKVDGALVPIAPAASTGLLEARLPAGQHMVNLRLETTPVQVLGNAISLGTMLVIVALLMAARQSERGAVRSSDEPNNWMPGWEGMTLGVMGVVLFVARLGLASLAPSAVPLGPHMPSTATRASIDLGGQVRLIGYEFSSPTVRAGETLTVTLYWQTQALLLTSYKSFVHVMDAKGQLVAQSDVVPRNWTYPTSGWLPNEWIGDPHKLDIPKNVAGSLEVWIGMYDPDTGQRLNPPGDPSGRVKLGTLSQSAP
jgi:hypothetical protein